MRLWIAYLAIAVISAILFRWFLHGIPAAIAVLLCVVFSIMCFLRLMMGKKIKRTGSWG